MTTPPLPDTDDLRRLSFSITPARTRDAVRDAADEIDVLRSAIRLMLGPDTYDVIQRRAQARHIRGPELAAIRRAFTDPKASL